MRQYQRPNDIAQGVVAPFPSVLVHDRKGYLYLTRIHQTTFMKAQLKLSLLTRSTRQMAEPSGKSFPLDPPPVNLTRPDTMAQNSTTIPDETLPN